MPDRQTVWIFQLSGTAAIVFAPSQRSTVGMFGNGRLVRALLGLEGANRIVSIGPPVVVVSGFSRFGQLHLPKRIPSILDLMALFTSTMKPCASLDLSKPPGPRGGSAFGALVARMYPRCPGCCNPECLTPRPEIRSKRQKSLQWIESAKSIHGVVGLTLLGGEPTEQAPALVSLVQQVRSLGLEILLFTGKTWEDLRGFARPGGP